MGVWRTERKRMKINEQNLRVLWHTINTTNIHITVIPEKERRVHNEYLNKNAPKSRKDMNLQIQGSQRSLSRINSERPTLRHIIKL